MPVASALVVNLATPATRFAVPSVELPSRKVTVPVGVPLVAVTVAVKVTLVPTGTVAADEVRLVVVVGVTEAAWLNITTK